MSHSRASHIALLALLTMMSPSLSAASEATNTPEFCKLFQAAHAYLSERTGSRIDAITSLENVSVHCGKKTFVIRQFVSVPAKRLRSDWVARRDRAWTDSYCEPGSDFREAVLNGWTVQSEIATADGTEVQLIAQCFDAMANGRHGKMHKTRPKT